MGSTTLAFVSEDLAQSNGVEFVKNLAHNIPAGFEIAFIATDVDAAYTYAVTVGAMAVKEPMQKPCG